MSFHAKFLNLDVFALPTSVERCHLRPRCSKPSFILDGLLHDRKLVWQRDYITH